MRIKCRQENDADRWLREHDPYYTSKSGHKSKKEKYPYDTARQERTKAEVEIPVSNLNASQRRQMKEVAGAYDEDGNFNL